MGALRICAALVTLAVVVAACAGGSAPAATTAGQRTTGPGSASVAATEVSPTVATATAPAAAAAATPAPDVPTGQQADPCALVTKGEAEALAGGTVNVENGELPGPPGEGMFCRYTAANADELVIRTVPGRGDYDNDRKSSDGFGNHPVDVPGLGDEAWSDRGPLLGSINVVARGHWMRISASLEFGKKPLDALPAIARQAIGRLP
jgi:hypothetical protein